MPFEAGRAKTGGRKKGVTNKTTQSVKEALQYAFDGMGGAKNLLKWAESNEDEFYKLWIKMLPTEVKNDLTSSDGSIMPVAIQVVGIDDSKD